MADRNVFGLIEDGQFLTTAPNPHVELAGTIPAAAYIGKLFDAEMATAETASITIRKDQANWSVYSGAVFTFGVTDSFDLSGATLVRSAGTINNSDPVVVMGLEPIPPDAGDVYFARKNGLLADIDARYIQVEADPVFTGSPAANVKDDGNTTEFLNGTGAYSVPASGEDNTSSNSGTGVELALPKAGVNLPFRTIIDTANVEWTQGGTELSATVPIGAFDAFGAAATVDGALTTHKSSADHDARYIQDAPTDGQSFVRNTAEWQSMSPLLDAVSANSARVNENTLDIAALQSSAQYVRTAAEGQVVLGPGAGLQYGGPLEIDTAVVDTEGAVNVTNNNILLDGTLTAGTVVRFAIVFTTAAYSTQTGAFAMFQNGAMLPSTELTWDMDPDSGADLIVPPKAGTASTGVLSVNGSALTAGAVIDIRCAIQGNAKPITIQSYQTDISLAEATANGHAVIDEDGDVLEYRPLLQFTGAEVTDGLVTGGGSQDGEPATIVNITASGWTQGTVVENNIDATQAATSGDVDVETAQTIRASQMAGNTTFNFTFTALNAGESRNWSLIVDTGGFTPTFTVNGGANIDLSMDFIDLAGAGIREFNFISIQGEGSWCNGMVKYGNVAA